MNFVQKTGKTKRHITFEDVYDGQVFFYGGCAYMRINQSKVEGNAVLLNTMNQGNLESFEDDQNVVLLNACIDIEYTVDELTEWI